MPSDIASALLPSAPYQQYTSRCVFCKKSQYPSRILFFEGDVAITHRQGLSYHLVFVNIDKHRAINGHFGEQSQATPLIESRPGQITAIIPSGLPVSIHLRGQGKHAILCFHQSVIDKKALEISSGTFNHASFDRLSPTDSPLLVSILREIESALISGRNG